MPPCRNVLSTCTAGSIYKAAIFCFSATLCTQQTGGGTNGRKNDAGSRLCSRRVNPAIDSSLLITERDSPELMNFIYCQASFNRTMSNGGRTKVRLYHTWADPSIMYPPASMFKQATNKRYISLGNEWNVFFLTPLLARMHCPLRARRVLTLHTLILHTLKALLALGRRHL